MGGGGEGVCVCVCVGGGGGGGVSPLLKLQQYPKGSVSKRVKTHGPPFIDRYLNG